MLPDGYITSEYSIKWSMLIAVLHGEKNMRNIAIIQKCLLKMNLTELINRKIYINVAKKKNIIIIISIRTPPPATCMHRDARVSIHRKFYFSEVKMSYLCVPFFGPTLY